VLREVKRWGDAFEVLGGAVQRFPDDPDLLYEQAMVAEKLDRLDEMERLLRRSSSSSPTTRTPTTRWAIRWPIAASACPRRAPGAARAGAVARRPLHHRQPGLGRVPLGNLPKRCACCARPTRAARRRDRRPPGRGAVGRASATRRAASGPNRRAATPPTTCCAKRWPGSRSTCDPACGRRAVAAGLAAGAAAGRLRHAAGGRQRPCPGPAVACRCASRPRPTARPAA
jgi:hypothetical protein